MNKRISSHSVLSVSTPDPFEPQFFDDPAAAVDCLEALYDRNTRFLTEAFEGLGKNGVTLTRYRACYPQVSIETSSFGHVDSRLSYGYVSAPGVYTTTITRPKLFRHYLKEQLGHLMRNHGLGITVSESSTPVPLHFAFGEGAHVEASAGEAIDIPLRDLFDAPDLTTTDDEIANGSYEPGPGEPSPLAPFTAQRIDYSLARLSHYTATSATHFQNFVLFTNYQFYIDEFCAWARQQMAEGGNGYTAFVEPGNIITPAGSDKPETDYTLARLPQMPAYHLKKKGHGGITMVNIGVGPIERQDDHRPYRRAAPACLADARALRRASGTASASATMFLPMPICAKTMCWTTTCRSGSPCRHLPEVQVALQDAVAEVHRLPRVYDLKQIMRTGTVATIDNRNWELRDQRGPGQAPVAGARDRTRHGIGDDRGQRLPLPRALRHAALRFRQAASRRVEASGHGNSLLPDTGQPASEDRHPRFAETCGDAA